MHKSIDPDDSYVVRQMFGCGHGNVTHWRKRKQYANVRAGYGVVAGSA